MSSLVVTDWKETPLTVKELVAKKLHQNPPFLAYLSACSTAKNQAEVLQDEGLHLMAACQLAGFQHVIGSLWAVSDSY
jgi:CHAT domain-containing protein